jgi:hypothetical protein
MQQKGLILVQICTRTRRLHQQLDATTLELAREIQISHPGLVYQK